MNVGKALLLAGVSSAALAAAGYAQDATGGGSGSGPDLVTLGTVTLVSDGQEDVEATGGVTVSPEDLELLQPADVSELFARTSAISVSAGAGPSKRIHVLGMEQSNLAVTVDGVPQGVTSWHHTGSNVIDPAFLKSVEVEVGAAAADAGFGAAAGAVRYETVGARDLLQDGRTMGGRAALSYGTNGRGLSASLAGFGVHEGLDWFVMVQGADGDNYEAANGREMPGTEPATQGVLLKLGHEVETHRLELAFEHSKDDADRVIKMNMDLNADDTVYPLKVTRNTLSLKYTTTAPTAAWDPEALFYVSRNEYWRNNYATGSRPYNGDMDLENETVGGVLKNTFSLPQGTVVAGVDWSYNDYSIDNYDGTGIGNSRRYWTLESMQVGTFVQGRFEFDNGIDVSTGLRFDSNRFTDWNGRRHSDTGASVNGTASYEFAEGFEVFAGASRTWLGYDFGEYGLLHARTSEFRVADDFDAATARNAKIGLNASQGNWTGNLTFFDTRLKDLGEYDTNADVYQLVNAEEYRSKGFTLQGTYAWDTGRLGVSFTKADVTQNGEYKVPDGGTVMPVGKMATVFIDQEIPQHNLTVGATVEWAGKLDTGSLVDDEGVDLGFEDHSSYTVVNAYGEWRPASHDNLVLRLGVDNLFDETYYERSSYVQRVAGTRTIDPVYGPGRTVTLGLKMDF